MPQPPPRPPGGHQRWTAERVTAQIASAYQHLQRSRQQVTSAMAQAKRVDRLLHAPAAGAVAERVIERPMAAGRRDLTQVMEHEVAVHQRAVALHEEAARLQEAGGWPERAATARAHAAHARELSRRAREELASYQARAAAAQERVDEAHQRLPEHRRDRRPR